MSNISKQIYRNLEDLFSDLQGLELFTRVDFASNGLPDVNIVVFESTPDVIRFVLCRYEKENGRTIANPYFEIIADPKKKTANVVTYRDNHYFHSAASVPREIGEMALSQANSLLYAMLVELKRQHQSKCALFH